MNANVVEKVVEKFFEMCRQHPEICPHDYHLYVSTKYEDGKCVEQYRCIMCGNEYTKEI